MDKRDKNKQSRNFRKCSTKRQYYIKRNIWRGYNSIEEKAFRFLNKSAPPPGLPLYSLF